MERKLIWTIIRAVVLAALALLAGYIYGKRDVAVPVEAGVTADPVRAYFDGGLVMEGISVDMDYMRAQAFDENAEETKKALAGSGLPGDGLKALLYVTLKENAAGEAEAPIGRIAHYVSLPREFSALEGRVKVYHLSGNGKAEAVRTFFRGSELAWISDQSGSFLVVKGGQSAAEVPAGSLSADSVSMDSVSGNEAPEEAELIAEEPDYVKYKVSSNVNVRKGPGTNTKILDNFKKGTIVEVVDTEDPEWYRIRYKDGEAYVNSHFVKEIKE